MCQIAIAKMSIKLPGIYKVKCIEVRGHSIKGKRGAKILDNVTFDINCEEFIAVSSPISGESLL